MATATELRDIFYNVIARTGGKKGTLAEYAKVISTMNAFKTYNELNPPMLPTNNNLGQNVDNMPQTPPSGTPMPPLGDNGLTPPQNTSNGMV